VNVLVNLLVVCAGSALGGGVRYLVGLAMGQTAFPWGTLLVNVVGCFAIMLVVTIASAATMPDRLLLFLTTGVMGGLTTYSAFDQQTTRLLQDGATTTALAYVAATLAICFVAGLGGVAVGRIVID
jgi:CrcB protein